MYYYLIHIVNITIWCHHLPQDYTVPLESAALSWSYNNHVCTRKVFTGSQSFCMVGLPSWFYCHSQHTVSFNPSPSILTSQHHTAGSKWHLCQERGVEIKSDTQLSWRFGRLAVLAQTPLSLSPHKENIPHRSSQFNIDSCNCVQHPQHEVDISARWKVWTTICALPWHLVHTTYPQCLKYETCWLLVIPSHTTMRLKPLS